MHAVRSLLERRPRAVAAAAVLANARAGALPALVRQLEDLGVPIERCDRAKLDRLAGTHAHQGVAVQTTGLAEIDVRELEALVLDRGRSCRLLVLDRVQDPRNLGACLRSADAAGVDAVVVPRAHAAKLTPAAVKSAAGAAETVALARVGNLASTLHWLKEAGLWVVGAAAEAERSIYAARLEDPIALVVGGEGQGLRRLTREICDEIVGIPMGGTVASLNVAVAAAVMLFELERQVRNRQPARRST
jgi:23S rRNA (guanosine2251-2'-O)-methyltransferase